MARDIEAEKGGFTEGDLQGKVGGLFQPSDVYNAISEWKKAGEITEPKPVAESGRYRFV